MIPLIYTWASLTSVLTAFVLDRWVLRTHLLRTKLFWASYAIIVFFQFIVNGVLTGLEVVQYHPDVILGFRVFYAPVEDLGFGFGLVCSTLAVWVKLTRTRPAGVGARSVPSSSDRLR